MSKAKVSLVRYTTPFDSVAKAVELCGGLDHLESNAKVFIKPNIVFWSRHVEFPKYGVITTSRVVEDMVRLLVERGVRDITIAEGMVTAQAKDTLTPADAFERLGYGELSRRYGVKLLNFFESSFEKVDFGGGVELNFSTDLLNCDFVVNLPVLKTHAQTGVSLGTKNLKGAIDMLSRKKCHNPDPERDLNYMVARLGDRLPPSLTLLDGIYTLERGPGFDGTAHRTDLLVASADTLSADLVGASVLGHPPHLVPHLVHAARNHGRPYDLSDIEVVGEEIGVTATRHENLFAYTEDGSVPAPFVTAGIEGLTYPKYDSTMCTYCALVNYLVVMSVYRAWKGERWDDVEVLTGKMMGPSPNAKKVILLGKCMSALHAKNPSIPEVFPVWGCPPKVEDIIEALTKSGISIETEILRGFENAPAMHARRYAGKPGFDESFHRIT